MEKNLIEKLQAPFSADEINFRPKPVSKDKKDKALAFVYVTNSAIQNRLDEVFGPFGWQVSFRDWKNHNAQICQISVFDKEKQIWIFKEDGASDTPFEPIKGGLSDSMKRCAKMFGIGRYLSSKDIFSNSWVTLDEYGKIIDKDITRLKNEYNQYISGQKSAACKPSSTITEINNIPTKSTTNKVEPSPKEKINNVANKPIPKKNEVPKVILNAITSLLSINKNTTLQSLLDHYQVHSLEELTLIKANDAIKKLSSNQTL